MARNPLSTLDAIRKKIHSQDEMLELYGDNFKRLDDLTRTSWRDLDLAGSSLGRGVTPPDFIQVNAGTIYLPGFNGGATTEQLFGAKEVDHDWWEPSTNIYPHVHWLPSVAAAGAVHWQLTYTIQNSSGGFGDVMPAETTITATQASSGTAWQEHFAGFGAIDMSDFTMGAQIAYRLFRDPTNVADTYGSDAALLTIGFHMQIRHFGSRNEFSR